ncbi:hypothetical protein [Marichromatium bheemlicum]|uniref:Uncharacterized protein n=1 Tax=Marichromatium bheemlicum TaxID=365339 RepID=A0ABX1IC81_9GAMM|nr:hypothetical protein [Marichromatium bheemlicum]NKN33970.1 hypothetical protein [Marichromatium bheemlicum]
MTARLERQVEVLRQRVERVESESRELRDGLTALAQEHAITRESVRIFTDLVEDVRDGLSAARADVHQVQLALQRHMTEEARDRRRQLVGSMTATISTLGTLAVLLWSVSEGSG